MRLHDRTDSTADLLARLPALPQVDLAHSTQVLRLALALFDDLAEPLCLSFQGRDLLAAAAYWHDVGQSIAEQGHHKHSYALIMALHLPQFGAWGKQQVACIARYHRKSLPDLEHGGFASLPGPARRQVQELAALLRVADGLDYSHRSLVRRLEAGVGARDVTVTVQAPPAVDVEIRRAYEKADLFRIAFARSLALRRMP